MSKSYDYFTQSSSDSQFDDFSKQADSTMTNFLVVSVVLGVVSTIATVAIVYAIINCLKKAGGAIPEYARIANSDYNSQQSSQKKHEHHISVTPEPYFIHSQQPQFATVERFLSNMAREKPHRFSREDIENLTERCSTILGSGGYGVVFKGILPDGIPVAVKVLTSHNSGDTKRMEEQFMAEVSTIGRTYHANLVTLYGFCFDPTMMALVYEYMENGSLNKLLFDEHREIEWGKLHDIAVGTAKGIAYLHEGCKQTIIHYDIKPENVLLDGNLNPKVADFGLAKLCNKENSKVTMSGGRGTLGYSAPEIWHRNFPVTRKCDVYSYGILLFEIVGRRRHFDKKVTESRQWLPRWTWEMHKNNELEVMLALCGIEEKHKAKAYRMCIVALLCVQHSPDARPLMSDVVKMLEGSMEIPQTPQNPFRDLETIPENSSTMYSESDEESVMSGFERVMSEIIRHQSRHETSEIELATI
ncbi:rust resistance kinase Lr10-like [Euphorbia lathyris]|uniref:rust resistance kinase Lr10-like n=1 Tax=Euphorbia lathyris TaxID=212925 RepID=UPI003313FD60